MSAWDLIKQKIYNSEDIKENPESENPTLWEAFKLLFTEIGNIQSSINSIQNDITDIKNRLDVLENP